MSINRKVIIISFLILILAIFTNALLLKMWGKIALVPEPADLRNSNSYQHTQNIYTSPISINYLRSQKLDSPLFTVESTLNDGSNYSRYIISYLSQGYKVFGLLTVPKSEVPIGGFPALVFNHGYIPPSQYVTTEKYLAYVDSLARSGFVVLKIDMRGHGNSQGEATGSYFSSAYTIDALSALSSLQKFDKVNPNRIGMWGHSMAGNLVLRAMLVSDQVKAGVIWAGAVYSYQDFAKYRLNDGSYVRRPDLSPTPSPSQTLDEQPKPENRELSPEVQRLRSNQEVDLKNDFWSSISLTSNLQYLNAPLQIHHSKNDSVVNIGYSRDLVSELKVQGKKYDFHEYEGGGHNIESPYFEEAMKNTILFFKENL